MSLFRKVLESIERADAAREAPPKLDHDISKLWRVSGVPSDTEPQGFMHKSLAGAPAGVTIH